MTSTNSKTKCTSGCKTQDHASYSECLRSKGLRVAYSNSTGKAGDATLQKKWDAELDFYRSAVRQGMQPESTKTKDIRAAVEWSDRHGQAYSAEAASEVRFDKAVEKSAA